ncbi:MAG: bifunctional riboflavin kinase/FAD synthetase [Chromatiales bacterium]|nr:bifunctional riboflavin kinase/FAD synthetase [Chromatiales bacterium]
MRLLHSLDSLDNFNHPCVATIGAFDALHIGHQRVIQQTKAIAKQYKLPSAVIMFEPLPGEFFATNDTPPKRIYPLRKRIELVKSLDVDYLVCLRFSAALANWTAADFVQRVILKGLCTRHLVVGDDFCFGKNREGDYNTLCDYGNRYGFEVSCTPEVTVDDKRISSTRIRLLLLAGEIDKANRLLGRPYSVAGRVGQGDRLATQLGYPTANLTFGKRQPPLQGVYAVSVKIQNAELIGVANAGVRPTVGATQYRIETHIFDFSKELYGQRLTVYPRYYLRAEQRYNDTAQLKDAICKDVSAAKSLLGKQ